jgi:hypothetical protein
MIPVKIPVIGPRNDHTPARATAGPTAPLQISVAFAGTTLNRNDHSAPARRAK